MNQPDDIPEYPDHYYEDRDDEEMMNRMEDEPTTEEEDYENEHPGPRGAPRYGGPNGE